MNKIAYFLGLLGGVYIILLITKSFWVVVALSFLWGFFYRRIFNAVAGVIKEFKK